VRDGGEYVFDSVDALVDHELAEAIVLVRVLAGVFVGDLRLHILVLQLDVLGRASVALETSFVLVIRRETIFDLGFCIMTYATIS